MSKDKTGAPVYGTVEDALKLIRSGDVIATPCYANEPSVFLSRLHTVAETLEGVRLWSTNPVHPYPVMTDPALNGHIDILSIFYGAPSRSGHPLKRISLAPTNLSASGPVQVQGRPSSSLPLRPRTPTATCTCRWICNTLSTFWRRRIALSLRSTRESR